MRTAIFVYEPTTLTITTSEPDLALISFGSAGATRREQTRLAPSALTSIDVEPGIYKILSVQPVGVTATRDSQIEVLASATKRPVPVPDPGAQLSLTGTEIMAALQAFLAVDARGLTL